MSLPAAFSPMHLLYLDDSGSVRNPGDKHVVFAGLSLAEKSPHWFGLELDKIAERVWPDNPTSLEFRGADIFSGKAHWRGIGKEERIGVYCEALKILARSTKIRLFGAAVHKAAVSPEDPMELAFEHLSNRFDRMLGRLHRAGDSQRGLIIIDKSAYEQSMQKLTLSFRTKGHRWGQLYNLADVPMFVDSKATRLVQYADMVAYSIRRYYEAGESTYFDIIKGRFDAEGGVIHGLVHVAPADGHCNCHACRQKAAR